ncbi:hypothetical protein [Pediococcus stilesii]|uniref:hypothetical protein n=1 Tax=Pediococcus stilesii TaxID=331679 RepID=UPI001BB12760|nr:hypothetical protein [Pediococcus stilesii]
MTDRSNQKLIVFKKDGQTVVEGKVGELTIDITGLKAGTVVAAGDYKLAFKAGEVLSELVDIDGFTVLEPEPVIHPDKVITATPSITLKQGTVGSGSFLIHPNNSTDMTATVTVADPDIALISESGSGTFKNSMVSEGNINVKGVKAGDTKLTVTSTDGGLTLDIDIKVEKAVTSAPVIGEIVP